MIQIWIYFSHREFFIPINSCMKFSNNFFQYCRIGQEIKNDGYNLKCSRCVVKQNREIRFLPPPQFLTIFQTFIYCCSHSHKIFMRKILFIVFRAFSSWYRIKFEWQTKKCSFSLEFLSFVKIFQFEIKKSDEILSFVFYIKYTRSRKMYPLSKIKLLKFIILSFMVDFFLWNVE